MHFFNIFIFLLASLVSAATTKASSSSLSSSSSSSLSSVLPTLVWVTGTNSAGVTMTTQSAYSQQFTSFYVTISAPSSGSMAGRSSSKELGKIKSYSYSTVGNGAGGDMAGLSSGLLVTTVLPLVSAFIGLFML